MLKFSLILPIILSSLYISLSRAQGTLSSCATNCSQIAGSSAGCNSAQLDQPNCVCTNAAFFGAASGCVWLSCSAAEATTAEDFWLGVCSAYMASLSASTATAPSSYGYVPPSSSVHGSSSSSGYGGHPSSQPTSSRSIYSPVTSTPTPTSYAYTFGGSSSTSSGTPYGAGSGSGSGTSSKPSSSPTSNLAATMPTQAAALIAGGIGAMVAVFV